MTTDERRETELERLDRHWIELLQEVRVMQTGVALLTGFLLTLPFQGRFEELPHFERGVFLFAVALSAASMACLIAPVAMHRLLFRHGARPRLVAYAQRLSLLGLALLAGAIAAVLTLIFDVVLGRTWGLVTGAVTLALVVTMWLVLPMLIRFRLNKASDPSGRHLNNRPDGAPGSAGSQGSGSERLRR